jgi:hypothetical protein
VTRTHRFALTGPLTVFDSVGIYHEAYRVSAGNFEVMYNHMPEVGLLAASGTRPLDPSSTSALRMGDRAEDGADRSPQLTKKESSRSYRWAPGGLG